MDDLKTGPSRIRNRVITRTSTMQTILIEHTIPEKPESKLQQCRFPDLAGSGWQSKKRA